MFKNNPALSQAMLAALKSELDGGAIHVFSGAEPLTADAPLDMSGTHTHLFTLLLDGTDGLELSAPNGASVSKPVGAVWTGLVSFDGAEDSAASLPPSFFRFCTAGDDGRGAGANARVQGSAGGPASAADMKLGSDTLVDDSVSTASVVAFNYYIGSMG